MPKSTRKKAKGSAGRELFSIFQEVLEVLLKNKCIPITDLEALRSTSKRIKTLVDTSITLKIDLGKPLPSAASCSSPLFRKVQLYRRGKDVHFDFWNMAGQPMLSFLEKIAPQLEFLAIAIKEDPENMVVSKMFSENYTFPNLQTLKLKKTAPGTVAALQKSFCSMESLSDFSQSGGGGLSLDDLRVLATASIMPALTHLELDCGELALANPSFTAPLKTIVHRLENLKTLKLSHITTSDIFDKANLLRLTRFTLKNSYVADTMKASLRNLEYLTLSGVTLATAPLRALLTYGKLMELRKLELIEMEIGDIGNDDAKKVKAFWSQFLSELNLPKVESLYFENIGSGFSCNSALRISEATPQVPKCKEYTVHFPKMSDAVHGTRATNFFSSGFCKRLEELELYNVNLASAGFQELIENAGNMCHLKRLAVGIRAADHIQLLADSFAEAQNFRKLEELELCISVQGSRSYWANYCKKVFEPIIPTLKLEIFTAQR